MTAVHAQPHEATPEPEPWRSTLTPELEAQLGVLWGKSNAGGTKEEPRALLLLQHLFDSLAVGELLWDHYLAPTLRQRLDDITGGKGRRFLAWLCGLHDVGKATPAFQSQVTHLRRQVEAAGLSFAPEVTAARRSWKHGQAGGRILADHLKAAWSESGGKQHQWVWPLIAGHHGVVPAAKEIQARSTAGRDPHGSRDPRWEKVQVWLLEAVTSSAGYSGVPGVEPLARPSRADQLLLSGLVVMADWVASNEQHIQGISDLDQVSLVAARRRAGQAWDDLGLRGGWGKLPSPDGDITRRRFGFAARPSQATVVEAALEMPAPGLLVVEAPMGEGKTESALAAAEVLAARFGADGLFMGMPTQGTADPMFSRVKAWSQQLAPDVPLALLHGRNRFNPEWDKMTRSRPQPAAQGPPTDDYGLDDPFGSVDQDRDLDGCNENGEGRAAARWFLGPKRGLLAPVVVGTIDQLLFAASSSRHVMLRYAGLAGKVVILDEVHAADDYMSQFLGEALGWLGEGQVPVVLLSATLAPEQRRTLVDSYVAGALGVPRHKVSHGPEFLPQAAGYPSVTSAWVEDNQPHAQVQHSSSWRDSARTAVEVLAEPEDDETGPVVSALQHELADGGCALVIRNTVSRAQETFAALSAVFPDEVDLLHSRLTAADRAGRTERLVQQLGPNGDARPRRRILVATQVAEQSFDVDADLLVTDLAPLDLLLQRSGRLHRHDRPVEQRPARLRSPRILVTGFSPGEDGAPPSFPCGSRAVYGDYLLLTAAAAVLAASEADGWTTPDDVPGLVAGAYGQVPSVPDGWAARVAEARQRFDEERAERQAKAKPYLLLSASGSTVRKDLQGLHTAGDGRQEEYVRVRDGDAGEEVLLVQRDGEGFRSFGGQWLGRNGEALAPGDAGFDAVNELLGGLVRLPAHPAALAEQVNQLAGWPEHDNPWLRDVRMVVLDDEGKSGDLPGFALRYDPDLGLSVEKKT